MECERIHIFVLQILEHTIKRYECLLGCVYMNCECIRGDENGFKMKRVGEVATKAKRMVLKV